MNADFSLTTPLPADFLQALTAIPGLDSVALTRSLQTPPSVSVRRNVRKSTSGQFAERGSAVPWCADGRSLSERPRFTLDPLLHAGVYYVQDASSMIYQQIMERLAQSFGGEPLAVLDFCAAPGGKTTAIINALPDHSLVVANEFVASRGKILRENLEKWGYPGIITTGNSSAEFSNLTEIFDIVAIDAPCSGEGMMRKDEEARRQWSRRLVDSCASLQREILGDLVAAIRPGGFLVYSTCTFNLDENEKNSLWIAETLGLRPVPVDSLRLQGIERVGRACLPGVEALRFMQHMTPEGEGQYVAVFRKPGKSNSLLSDQATPVTPLAGQQSGKKKGRKGKGKSAERSSGKEDLTQDIRRELDSWFEPEWNMQFEVNSGLVTALPGGHLPLHERLSRAGIRVTGAGLPVAGIKGSSLIPDSRVALSTALRREAFPRIPLTLEESLSYLRRELTRLPEGIPTGYVVMEYSGHALGMMKNIGNRANNLFPIPWRIRI